MQVRYLLIQDIMERIRLSRSTLYRKMKAGTFPAPYELSANRSGWLESEIDEWCQSRERRRTVNRVGATALPRRENGE